MDMNPQLVGFIMNMDIHRVHEDIQYHFGMCFTIHTIR